MLKLDLRHEVCRFQLLPLGNTSEKMFKSVYDVGFQNNRFKLVLYTKYIIVLTLQQISDSTTHRPALVHTLVDIKAD